MKVSRSRNEPPLFFYDAECGMCDASVQLLLRWSDPDRLHFAPLQSEVAQSILAAQGIVDPEMKAAYFWNHGRVVARSSAILEGLSCCRFPYSGLRVFRWIPVGLRDAVYRLIARNRYRISRFRSPQCRVPSAVDRSRFVGAY